MLTTIEGIYEDGQIILKENPTINQRVKVFVMFTDEEVNDKENYATIAKKNVKEKLRGAWKNASLADKEEIKTYFDNIRNEWERDI